MVLNISDKNTQKNMLTTLNKSIILCLQHKNKRKEMKKYVEKYGVN